jgi:hypothetical protein
MDKKSIIPDVIEMASNRRSFVKKLGIAGAALGAVATLGVEKASAATATDVDVLNFALNLEFLEAEFYTVATTGKTLKQSGLSVGSSPGTVSGGNQVTLANSRVFTQAVAMEIAADERAHVALLQGALGAAAISEPSIDLNALGFGFGSQDDFLKLARIFEDIGVSAYAGAAPLLSPTIVATAARILAAEAEHVANIRLQIARLNIATAVLDGVDILPPPSNPGHYFSLNAQALCSTRSPGQVLFLAYGGKGNASAGGFFPDGANGYYTTSSATAA